MKAKLLSCVQLVFISLLLALTVIAVPTTVLAIADPDDLQVLAAYVYEDCLEAGDTGVLIYYLIDYAVLPTTETATEAYLFIFIDTDGTTQLKASSPYTFVDSGYGYGMVWIYFTAAEAASYSLNSADAALYSVRLSGNPTVGSGWTGDPPSTSAGIDYWQTEGTTSVLVALRVLYYADQLELLWALDMVESTPLGNKLATLGEEYFTNVIPGLRTIAPSAFSYSAYEPLDPDIDYVREFGATVSNGTGIVTGSPITLTEGANNVTVTAIGTIIVELTAGTVGTATNGTGVITGSPIDLSAGTNTITATAVGNITVDVWLNTTQTGLTDTITGTGWDLTVLATLFGMSRMWMSTIVWSIVTILVCAAAYNTASKRNAQGAGKVVFFIFDSMFLGGIVIGMVPLVAGVLIFLGCNAFIGYILFFRPANV